MGTVPPRGHSNKGAAPHPSCWLGRKKGINCDELEGSSVPGPLWSLQLVTGHRSSQPRGSEIGKLGCLPRRDSFVSYVVLFWPLWLSWDSSHEDSGVGGRSVKRTGNRACAEIVHKNFLFSLQPSGCEVGRQTAPDTPTR